MLKPLGQIEALIQAQKHAAVQETVVRQSNSLEESARLKLLDRLQYEEYQERKERDGMSSETKNKADKIRKQECGEKLAINIDRHNRLISRDETMRRMVRNNTEELRILECKLRSAVIGQGLKAQLQEREAVKLQEKVCNICFRIYVLFSIHILIIHLRLRTKNTCKSC